MSFMWIHANLSIRIIYLIFNVNALSKSANVHTSEYARMTSYEFCDMIFCLQLVYLFLGGCIQICRLIVKLTQLYIDYRHLQGQSLKYKNVQISTSSFQHRNCNIHTNLYVIFGTFTTVSYSQRYEKLRSFNIKTYFFISISAHAESGFRYGDKGLKLLFLVGVQKRALFMFFYYLYCLILSI